KGGKTGVFASCRLLPPVGPMGQIRLSGRVNLQHLSCRNPKPIDAIGQCPMPRDTHRMVSCAMISCVGVRPLRCASRIYPNFATSLAIQLRVGDGMGVDSINTEP